MTTKTKSISKKYYSAAERAAEWYAIKVCKCVITRKAIRTQWQKVDFFNSDVVGKMKNGRHVYIQVTTGKDAAISIRRKKLTQIPWHSSDIVLLLQLKEYQDPENGRKKLWYFKLFYYHGNPRQWKVKNELYPIKKIWFTKYTKEKDEENV